MAFALVGSPTRYDANGTGPVVLTKPTGVAQDDILFAFIKNTANPTAVPSGWTQLGFVTDALSGSRYMVYQLVAGASEGADYTWTFASYSRTGATMVAYRDGFDPADPIDVVSATNYTTSNTTVRAAGVTAAAANSPIIFFGGQHSSSSVTYTPPTNPGTFAEDDDFWQTGSRFGREIASFVWTGSGATGDMDATSSATTASKGAIAVVLNPASGASEDVAAAGTLSITGAAVLNAAGSLAAAGAASITGAADLDATGTLAAAGAVSITGAADLDAAGSLAAAGALAITGAADLDAIGNLLAAGSLEIAGAADLTGAAANDISASGSLSVTGSADLDAIGQLLAAGSIVITGAADLTGVSANDIAASGALSINGTADLDAIGQLLAAGSIFITGVAALTSGAVDAGVAGIPGGSGYPVYWQGKRRKRRLEEQPNLHLKKVLDDVVNELYGELTEDDVPPAVQAKAAKLVKPFVAKKSKTLAIPPVAAVDWAALERDATRVRQLIALWRKQEEDVEIEAEDEYLLMMS